MKSDMFTDKTSFEEKSTLENSPKRKLEMEISAERAAAKVKLRNARTKQKQERKND